MLKSLVGSLGTSSVVAPGRLQGPNLIAKTLGIVKPDKLKQVERILESVKVY